MPEHKIAMKLNHMSFPTTDMEATSTFFEKYLGFSIAGKTPRFYILKRPGLDVVIEKVADDSPTPSILAASNIHSKEAKQFIGEDHQWPKAFHVGLELPTLDDVRAMRDKLSADGFDAETDVFYNERGSRFFCRAPGGVMFEFTTRSDAEEQYRGTFDN